MNIGFLVNGRSLDVTKSLKNYSRKLIIFGDSHKRIEHESNSTKIIGVQRNNCFLTAIAEVVSNPDLISDWTHILTIDDSMQLGKNTLELCRVADPTIEATAAVPDGLYNLVLYKKEYLFSLKEHILTQSPKEENFLYQKSQNKQLFPAAKILSLGNKKNYFPALQIIQEKNLESKSSSAVDMNKIFEFYTHDEFLYSWSIKEPEAQVLFNCVQKIQAKKIVVVGVFKGVSTKVILQAIGDREFDYIINIDPFFKDYHAGGSYYDDFMAAMKNVYNGEIIVLKGFASSLGKETTKFTQDDVSKIPEYRLAEINEQIDLCFIDGDHHFPTCLEDFKLIWKKIRKNGIVLLHDVTNQGWKNELQGLLDYIMTLPDAKLNIFYGIDGMGIVEKI